MTFKSRIALAAATVALLSTAYVAGRQVAYAQTQAQMDDMAYRDWQKSDKELNIVYRQLLTHYNPKDQDDAPTYKKIVASERAWIAYRDAQSDMDASIGGEGGTIYPTLYYAEKKDLTDLRTKALKDYITEIRSR